MTDVPSPENADDSVEQSANVTAARISVDVTADLLRQSLEVGQGCSARVVSGSMSPLICLNDIVMTESVSQRNVRLGDVLLAQSGGALLTHRLIDQDASGQIILKGDGNMLPDDPISWDAVIGRVVAIQRTSGRIILLKRPTVRALSCILAGISRVAGQSELKSRRSCLFFARAMAKSMRGLLRLVIIIQRGFLVYGRVLPKA